MEQNPLIQKFKNKKVWVSWKLIERDGKKTKIPYQADNITPASSTDPSTWSLYENIKGDMRGIVLPLDKRLLFVDIDKCINKLTNKIEHEQKEQIEKLLQEANTYTELSPSGTGLHLFLSIVEEEGLTLQGNRKSPYELYTSGRYFTFTSNSFGEVKPIREVTIKEVEDLLSIIGYPFQKKEIEQTILPAKYTNLDDETILSKMFTSKNGVSIRNLYNGDSTQYANDKSRADSALLSHLAFWTGRNSEQMERIWTSSPLGQREKTLNRKDYRTSVINYAVNNCRTIYEVPKKKESSEIEFLTVTKKVGDNFIVSIIQNTENIARVLRQDPDFAGKLRYDKFRNTMEFCGDNDWSVQENAIAIKLQSLISIKYPEFAKVPKEMVSDAMILVSKENTFDSAIDYIREQVWDKVPRLDTWLCKTYGVEDNKYHRAVGSNWLKGLVKRLIEPGCKFDYVLVLEGEQGSKKSTSLSILGGKWHVETSMGVDNKDFFMQFQGKSIIEFSEGETLSRTEVKKMKAIITTQYDKYRPPYERVSQDFPRRCVFAMTTNETEYLKDETGNRRWLPVKLIKEEADVEWLSNNRNQLFAEAYHRLVVLKESVHEFPKEETKEEQAKRRILDPNTDGIVEWYMNNLTDLQREEGVTVMMAYEQVINKKGGGQIDRLNEIIIGGIYKEILKLEKKRVMKDGVSSSRYFYTGKLLVAPKDSLDINTW